MADDLEHRQVGGRVGVRVGRVEVDALVGGDPLHRLGLRRPVGVELHLAGVATLAVELGPAGNRLVGAEVA